MCNMDDYKQPMVGDANMQLDWWLVLAYYSKLHKKDFWIIFAPIEPSTALCSVKKYKVKRMAIINIRLSASFPLNLH